MEDPRTADAKMRRPRFMKHITLSHPHSGFEIALAIQAMIENGPRKAVPPTYEDFDCEDGVLVGQSSMLITENFLVAPDMLNKALTMSTMYSELVVMNFYWFEFPHKVPYADKDNKDLHDFAEALTQCLDSI